jgi:hypothetical protein
VRTLLPFEQQDLKANKSIAVYTDYPFIELGDVAGEVAPIRKAQLLSYDWNKYCLVKVEGQELEVKSGYLYMLPNRYNENSSYANPVRLMLSNKDYALLQHENRKVKSSYEITIESELPRDIASL